MKQQFINECDSMGVVPPKIVSVSIDYSQESQPIYCYNFSNGESVSGSSPQDAVMQWLMESSAFNELNDEAIKHHGLPFWDLILSML